MFLTIKERYILWKVLYELTEKLLTDDFKKQKEI